jgi:hypothetical protein
MLSRLKIVRNNAGKTVIVKNAHEENDIGKFNDGIFHDEAMTSQ